MIPGLLPIFLHGCDKIWEWPGDEATSASLLAAC